MNQIEDFSLLSWRTLVNRLSRDFFLCVRACKPAESALDTNLFKFTLMFIAPQRHFKDTHIVCTYSFRYNAILSLIRHRRHRSHKHFQFQTYDFPVPVLTEPFSLTISALRVSQFHCLTFSQSHNLTVFLSESHAKCFTVSVEFYNPSLSFSNTIVIQS